MFYPSFFPKINTHFLHSLVLLYLDYRCKCVNGCRFEMLTPCLYFFFFSNLSSSSQDIRHFLRHHCKRGQQRVAHLHSQWETRAIHFLETHNPIRWVYFTPHIPMLMNGRTDKWKAGLMNWERKWESMDGINSTQSADKGDLIVVLQMLV